MSREIKFRAWDKQNKQMRYETIPNSCNYLNSAICDAMNKYGLELMQYTGLNDKNGKQIYEGDIVKAYKHGDTEKPAWTGAVTFNNGCFCFRGHNWHEFLNWFRMIEVVGNIYEQEATK